MSSLFRLPGWGRLRVVLVLLFALAGLAGEHFARGRVVSVADGDTITIYSRAGERQRIRLYGIDCPEYNQPGGEAATDCTRSLARFADVTLTVMDKDRYGRLVAVVTLPDGAILNEELLRNGHAWVYEAHCTTERCKGWRELQAGARRDGRGLWSGEKPVPPWKWRGMHRQ